MLLHNRRVSLPAPRGDQKTDGTSCHERYLQAHDRADADLAAAQLEAQAAASAAYEAIMKHARKRHAAAIAAAVTEYDRRRAQAQAK